MKRLTVVFLGFLLISSMVAADPLYKWVDAQGNVHYSDKPQPGAKKMVLPKAATFTSPQVAPAASTASDSDHRHRSMPSDEPAAPSYTAITITSPKDQDTIWNTDTVTVSVSVAPGLKPGDTVSISLDGDTQAVQGTSATFTGLIRGPHTVSATVGDLKAAPISFYIQKTSINRPPTH